MTRYYGWRIVWALAVTQTVGFGVLYYAFSVFIGPMEAELGWSRAQTSGAFSLALLLSGVGALPAGRFVDKHGARWLMSLSSLLGALLVFAWSGVQSLTVFYLLQGAIGLVMAAVLYDVAFTVIAVWFRRDRARALLIVTLVAGLASTIFIPLTTFLVEMFGWREALKVLALILGGTTVPLHAATLRRHPRDLNLEPDGVSQATSPLRAEHTIRPTEALRAPTFWWLSSAFSLSRITMIAVAAHIVPLLYERGYTPTTVAAAAGSIGLMQLAGRLFFTPATGRVPLTTLTAVTFGFHVAALLILLLLPGLASVWLFAAFFGMANGAGTLARAALVADTFGAAHYGSINGAMATIIAVVQTVAPLGAGALHDAFGSYTPVLWTLTGVSSLAALLVVQAQPRKEGAYAD